MKRILVTGGAGYIGAVLVRKLLEQNYFVSVLDLFIYGENVLSKHRNLKLIKGDIRDQSLLISVLPEHDTVIHLACISNDPSFELNPHLGKSINLDAFRPLVDISINSGIKRFIYASSSSVYGVKNEKNVHEEMLLEPLTDYSRFKVACEEILLEYKNEDFTTVVIRPATVCGYSPRQRLDLVVNILTNVAFHKREIKIFGGNQLRPNIHIKDMIEAYLVLIKTPKEKINRKIFNIGFENQTVENLAISVKEVIGSDVRLTKEHCNDNRSYHISSKKIQEELGFLTKYTVKDAINDLKDTFENKLFYRPLENENYFNVKKMQSINLK
jgi:nucleoside-diphosphate-sugar epimerase|tara:strand:- start:817 stop:1797 length:981 start_codon:yes stop_codon:yes gene_type:complete